MFYPFTIQSSVISQLQLETGTYYSANEDLDKWTRKAQLRQYLSSTNGLLDGKALKEVLFPKGKYHIFLSHSHEDLIMAQYLNAWFNISCGLKCFIDADVWALVHPFITTIAKDRVESGFYVDAVENACKILNNRVREIVQAKTGEEYDGAKLMQKTFSADNPIIKLEKGTSQSAHDTQLGYMQIFSGVMTGIRNPKAHEIENITREDAFRKLIMLSILMYKLDRATELS